MSKIQNPPQSGLVQPLFKIIGAFNLIKEEK